MNDKKKIKVWHKVTFILLVVVIVCGAIIWVADDRLMYDAKIRFLQQYYETYEMAKQELDSAEYFELDWLKTSALTMWESGGKKEIKSSCAYGSKMIHKNYVYSTRNMICNLIDVPKNYSVYNTKLQMWGGNFILKNIIDNLTSGVDENDRYNRALLIYNHGYKGLKVASTHRVNYKYVRHVTEWYTKLKYEWDEYPKW